MALFDERPPIKKNSFTIEDASTVFQNAAEKIQEGSLPAEAVEILLDIARLVLTVGQSIKAV